MSNKNFRCKVQESITNEGYIDVAISRNGKIWHMLTTKPDELATLCEAIGDYLDFGLPVHVGLNTEPLIEEAKS